MRYYTARGVSTFCFFWRAAPGTILILSRPKALCCACAKKNRSQRAGPESSFINAVVMAMLYNSKRKLPYSFSGIEHAVKNLLGLGPGVALRGPCNAPTVPALHSAVARFTLKGNPFPGIYEAPPSFILYEIREI